LDYYIVIVPDAGPGNQPVINSPGAVCKELIIHPAANLTISSGNDLHIGVIP
jgi:hypothetical protein